MCIRNAPSFNPLEAGELVQAHHLHWLLLPGQSGTAPPAPVQVKMGCSLSPYGQSSQVQPAKQMSNFQRTLKLIEDPLLICLEALQPLQSLLVKSEEAFQQAFTFCKDHDCHQSACLLSLNCPYSFRSQKPPPNYGVVFSQLCLLKPLIKKNIYKNPDW